jgi:hypothetical protein
MNFFNKKDIVSKRIKHLLIVCLSILINTSFSQVITNNGVVATISPGLVISAASLSNNSGTFSNNGSLTLSSAISNNGTISGNGTFIIGGNWSNNGTFSAGTSLVNFNGNAAQSIGGNNTTAFYNLTLNNSNGLSLSLNTSLNGTITFTNGKISTGSNILSLSNTASLTGAGNGRYVFGNLSKGIPSITNVSRTFEVGDASNYSPVVVDFIGTPNATGTLTVSTNASQHPDINTSGLNPAKDVARYWTITNSGVTSFSSYNPTFNFVSADIIGSANYANFHVAQWNGLSWSSTTDGTEAPASTQCTGITDFGSFAVGEACVTPVVTIINQTGTNVLTCAMTSINVIATGGNLYLWDNGSTTANRTINSAGTYSVTVTNTSGGCIAIGTLTITASGNAPIPTATQGTNIACNGGTTSITVTATGGITPYTGTGTYSGISAGTYTYTVTGGNGCLASTSITISQPIPLTFTTTLTNVSGCGSALGSISITASGGSGSKVYSKNNGSAYQGASLFSNLSAGTYTTKVKDANGCLSPSSTNIIATNAGITFNATVVNATSCSASNGKITVIASGGSGFFNYSKDGGTTYQSSNIFNSIASGTYSIKVKDVSGCFSGISPVAVGPTCGTRIEENSEPIYSLHIYPNPVDDLLNISFSSEDNNDFNLQLSDISGRIIINENHQAEVGNNQYQVDVSTIARGVYIVSLKKEDAVLKSKLVIQ